MARDPWGVVGAPKSLGNISSDYRYFLEEMMPYGYSMEGAAGIVSEQRFRMLGGKFETARDYFERQVAPGYQRHVEKVEPQFAPKGGRATPLGHAYWGAQTSVRRSMYLESLPARDVEAHGVSVAEENKYREYFAGKENKRLISLKTFGASRVGVTQNAAGETEYQTAIEHGKLGKRWSILRGHEQIRFSGLDYYKGSFRAGEEADLPDTLGRVRASLTIGGDPEVSGMGHISTRLGEARPTPITKRISDTGKLTAKVGDYWAPGEAVGITSGTTPFSSEHWGHTLDQLVRIDRNEREGSYYQARFTRSRPVGQSSTGWKYGFAKSYLSPREGMEEQLKTPGGDPLGIQVRSGVKDWSGVAYLQLHDAVDKARKKPGGIERLTAEVGVAPGQLAGPNAAYSKIVPQAHAWFQSTLPKHVQLVDWTERLIHPDELSDLQRLIVPGTLKDIKMPGGEQMHQATTRQWEYVADIGAMFMHEPHPRKDKGFMSKEMIDELRRHQPEVADYAMAQGARERTAYKNVFQATGMTTGHLLESGDIFDASTPGFRERVKKSLVEAKSKAVKRHELGAGEEPSTGMMAREWLDVMLEDRDVTGNRGDSVNQFIRWTGTSNVYTLPLSDLRQFQATGEVAGEEKSKLLLEQYKLARSFGSGSTGKWLQGEMDLVQTAQHELAGSEQALRRAQGTSPGEMLRAHKQLGSTALGGNEIYVPEVGGGRTVSYGRHPIGKGAYSVEAQAVTLSKKQIEERGLDPNQMHVGRDLVQGGAGDWDADIGMALVTGMAQLVGEKFYDMKGNLLSLSAVRRLGEAAISGGAGDVREDVTGAFGESTSQADVIKYITEDMKLRTLSSTDVLSEFESQSQKTGMIGPYYQSLGRRMGAAGELADRFAGNKQAGNVEAASSLFHLSHGQAQRPALLDKIMQSFQDYGIMSPKSGWVDRTRALREWSGEETGKPMEDVSLSQNKMEFGRIAGPQGVAGIRFNTTKLIAELVQQGKEKGSDPNMGRLSAADASLLLTGKADYANIFEETGTNYEKARRRLGKEVSHEQFLTESAVGIHYGAGYMRQLARHKDFGKVEGYGRIGSGKDKDYSGDLTPEELDRVLTAASEGPHGNISRDVAKQLLGFGDFIRAKTTIAGKRVRPEDAFYAWSTLARWGEKPPEGMKGLATGGRVVPGNEAIVGEAGPEHLRVTPQGTAEVTPLTGSARGLPGLMAGGTVDYNWEHDLAKAGMRFSPSMMEENLATVSARGRLLLSVTERMYGKHTGGGGVGSSPDTPLGTYGKRVHGDKGTGGLPRVITEGLATAHPSGEKFLASEGWEAGKWYGKGDVTEGGLTFSRTQADLVNESKRMMLELKRGNRKASQTLPQMVLQEHLMNLHEGRKGKDFVKYDMFHATYPKGGTDPTEDAISALNTAERIDPKLVQRERDLLAGRLKQHGEFLTEAVPLVHGEILKGKEPSRASTYQKRVEDTVTFGQGLGLIPGGGGSKKPPPDPQVKLGDSGDEESPKQSASSAEMEYRRPQMARAPFGSGDLAELDRIRRTIEERVEPGVAGMRPLSAKQIREAGGKPVVSEYLAVINRGRKLAEKPVLGSGSRPEQFNEAISRFTSSILDSPQGGGEGMLSYLTGLQGAGDVAREQKFMQEAASTGAPPSAQMKRSLSMASPAAFMKQMQETGFPGMPQTAGGARGVVGADIEADVGRLSEGLSIAADNSEKIGQHLAIIAEDPGIVPNSKAVVKGLEQAADQIKNFSTGAFAFLGGTEAADVLARAKEELQPREKGFFRKSMVPGRLTGETTGQLQALMGLGDISQKPGVSAPGAVGRAGELLGQGGEAELMARARGEAPIGGGGRGGGPVGARASFGNLLQEFSIGGAYFRMMAVNRLLGQPVTKAQQAATGLGVSQMGFGMAMGGDPQAIMGTPLGQIAAYQAQTGGFQMGFGESSLASQAGLYGMGQDMLGGGDGSPYAFGRQVGAIAGPPMKGLQTGLTAGIIMSAVGQAGKVAGYGAPDASLGARVMGGIGKAAMPVALGATALTAGMLYAGQAYQAGAPENIQMELLERQRGLRPKLSGTTIKGMAMRGGGEPSPGFAPLPHGGGRVTSYEELEKAYLGRLDDVTLDIMNATIHLTKELQIEGVTPEGALRLGGMLEYAGVEAGQIAGGAMDERLRQMAPLEVAGVTDQAMTSLLGISRSLGIAPGQGMNQYLDQILGQGMSKAGFARTEMAYGIIGPTAAQVGQVPTPEMAAQYAEQLKLGVPSWQLQQQAREEYGALPIVQGLGLVPGSPAAVAASQWAAGPPRSTGKLEAYIGDPWGRGEGGRGEVPGGTEATKTGVMNWVKGKLGFPQIESVPSIQHAVAGTKVPRLTPAEEQVQGQIASQFRSFADALGMGLQESVEYFDGIMEEIKGEWEELPGGGRRLKEGRSYGQIFRGEQARAGMGAEAFGFYTGGPMARDYLAGRGEETLAEKAQRVQAEQFAAPMYQLYGGGPVAAQQQTQRYQGLLGTGLTTGAVGILQQQMQGAGAVAGALKIPYGYGRQAEAPFFSRMLGGQMNAQQYQQEAAAIGYSQSDVGWSMMAGGMGPGGFGAEMRRVRERGELSVPGPGAMPIYGYGPKGKGGGIYNLPQVEQQNMQWAVQMGTGAYAQQAIPQQFGGDTFRMGMPGRIEQAGINLQNFQHQRGLREQLFEMSHSNQLAGIGRARESASLQFRQSLESLALQKRMWGVRSEFQRREFGFTYQQMGQQREWGREDFAYNRQMAGMQFEWQGEDLDRAIRFATGREKEQLIRQRGRGEEMFSIQEGRRATEEGRQEEVWQQEEEKFSRQVAHFEEINALEGEQFAMRKRHLEESFALQMKHLAEQEGELNAAYELQKELRKSQDDASEQQLKRTLAQEMLNKRVAEAQIAAAIKLRDAYAAILEMQLGPTIDSVGGPAHDFGMGLGEYAAPPEEGTLSFEEQIAALLENEAVLMEKQEERSKLNLEIQEAEEISLAARLEQNKVLYAEDGLVTLGMKEYISNTEELLVVGTEFTDHMDKTMSGKLTNEWDKMLEAIYDWVTKIKGLVSHGDGGGSTVTIIGTTKNQDGTTTVKYSDGSSKDFKKGETKFLAVGGTILPGGSGVVGEAGKEYVQVSPSGTVHITPMGPTIGDALTGRMRGVSIGNTTVNVQIPPGDYDENLLAGLIGQKVEDAINEVARKQATRGEPW